MSPFHGLKISRASQNTAPQVIDETRHGPSVQQFPTQSNVTSIRRPETSAKTFKRERDDSQDALSPPLGLDEKDGLSLSPRHSSEDLEKQMGEMQMSGDQSDGPKDPNIVDWEGDDDPENPQNFPTWRKWLITIMLGFATLTVTFASSVFSTSVMPTAELFEVSPALMVLGVSLFILGFAFGPVVFGPISELFGRKLPLFTGLYIFAIFQIPVAVAQNLQTIFVCRFFGGFFACAPLAVTGGVLADMFDPVNRGLAVAVFSANVFIGPVLGPIMGGFITMSYLGWRWTQWMTLIMALFFTTIAFFFVPETYAPVLLQRRAQKLRSKTRNWALHAEADEQEVDLKDIIARYLLRPFKMLALEPILVLITLYMGLIYGFLYLCLEAFPISYQEQRGWNMGVGALPFVAVMIGVMIGVGIIAYFTKTRFKRKMEAENQVVPEERLIPMIIGGFLLPAGMFWFAWTSNPDIIWIPQVVSGVFIGAGIMLIFMQGLNYLIDVYATNANSALAANSLFRSSLGAAFPMFATGMFHNLGVPWAMSLLGFLTAALFPVPILFYVFGSRIRCWSKYSPT